MAVAERAVIRRRAALGPGPGRADGLSRGRTAQKREVVRAGMSQNVSHRGLRRVRVVLDSRCFLNRRGQVVGRVQNAAVNSVKIQSMRQHRTKAFRPASQALPAKTSVAPLLRWLGFHQRSYPLRRSGRAPFVHARRLVNSQRVGHGTEWCARASAGCGSRDASPGRPPATEVSWEAGRTGLGGPRSRPINAT